MVGLAKYTLLFSKDDQKYQITGSTFPIKDNNDKIIGALVMFKDVTKEYWFQKELHKSEKKYREIFDNTKYGIYLHKLTENGIPGKFIEVNKTACEMLCYTKEELMNMSLYDIAVPGTKEKVSNIMEKLLEKEHFTFKIKHKTKNGSLIPVEISSNLFIMDKERYVLSIFRDIARREHAEKLLNKTKECLQLALKVGGMGTWDWNIRTDKVIFNHRWVQMKGYSLNEIEPHMGSWKELINPEDLSKVMESLDANLEGKTEFYNAKYRMRHKSGKWLWIKDRGKVVEKDNEGKPIRAWGVHLDITKPIKADKENKKLQQRLRQSQKMESIGRLASGVAHDMNNLISPILGYSRMLQKKLDKDSNEIKYVDNIYKAGDSAKNLVRQLLAFSNKKKLKMEAVSLNEIIYGFKNLIQQTIHEDIKINYDLDQSIPMIKADINEIEQIIMNMAVNAQDAMPQGGELTIETGVTELKMDYKTINLALEPGEFATLTIKDNGYGMDKETQKKIFGAFFSTKGDEGTGLGLSTVYNIIKKHNGDITVESEPNKGSIFTIYFPAIDHINKKDNEEMEDGALDIQGSEKILIAEDEKKIRQLLHDSLTNGGYQVIIAKDGQEALNKIRKYRRGSLDLLLTDIVMPKMNGKKLHDKLIEKFPDLKTIYMSGYCDEVLSDHNLLDSNINYIQKPLNISELAHKIREVLDAT